MSEQGSQEWLAERAGKWTGSKFVDVMAISERTGKPLKARSDAIWQVVVERMTGQAIEGPGGFALAWGHEVEQFARDAYELETGNVVQQVGFIEHQEFPFAGASPDGLIDNDGGLELKCPRDSRVHLDRFLSGVPSEHIPQIQGCMWVTGRQWWHFASYDPRMPESHRLLIIKVPRDEAVIAKIQAAVLAAEAEAQELHKQLLRISA